jgi:hypothetical protein
MYAGKKLAQKNFQIEKYWAPRFYSGQKIAVQLKSGEEISGVGDLV